MKSKITRLILALVATAALLPFLFFKPADERPAQKAGQYYRLQCSLLLQALISLNRQLAIKAPAPIIRQSFAEARAIYKRTELFTEYYFPLQARLINGPPQPLLEADNTDIAIEPHGFQVLEENIYSQKINYLRALMEARHLVNTVKALHGKASVLQMNDAGLFYALRQQMIRITALGICGFD
jgi:cytochrome c peroxidase